MKVRDVRPGHQWLFHSLEILAQEYVWCWTSDKALMTQLGKNNLFVLLSLCHCYQEVILLLMIILVYDALIPGRSPTILDQLKGWQRRLKQL